MKMPRIGNRRPGTRLSSLHAPARNAALIAAFALACLLLAGCSSLLGAGTPRTPVATYAPEARVTVDPAWPTMSAQLAIPPPTASRWTDSLRISVRPTPDELQVYKGARWARSPTTMVEDAVLRGLEDSGRITAVARQGSGIAADYRLILDLRRFEADYAGAAVPSATIEVSAKLLRSRDQQVVASRTFLAQQPAATTAVPDAAAAFGVALGDIATQLTGWTLSAGAQDRARASADAIP